VAAGHALGVHGEEAARLVPGAPQVRVKPGEAVGIPEDRGGACGARVLEPRPPWPRPSGPTRPRPHPAPAPASHLSYSPGPSRRLPR
jgi:hypothetical protein